MDTTLDRTVLDEVRAYGEAIGREAVHEFLAWAYDEGPNIYDFTREAIEELYIAHLERRGE